eukprot:163664-Chlamydomonas_euryale.AAC.1
MRIGTLTPSSFDHLLSSEAQLPPIPAVRSKCSCRHACPLPAAFHHPHPRFNYICRLTRRPPASGISPSFPGWPPWVQPRSRVHTGSHHPSLGAPPW